MSHNLVNLPNFLKGIIFIKCDRDFFAWIEMQCILIMKTVSRAPCFLLSLVLVAKPDLDCKVKLKLSLSTIKRDTSKLKPLLKLIKDLERENELQEGGLVGALCGSLRALPCSCGQRPLSPCFLFGVKSLLTLPQPRGSAVCFPIISSI